MNRMPALLFFLLLLFSCGGDRKALSGEAGKQRKIHPQPGVEPTSSTWNYPFLRQADPPVRAFHYPMTVQELVDRHGMPDSTRIHRDAFCPLGQFHFWSLAEKNLQFIALGTQTGKPVNYSAPAEVLILRPLHPGRPVDFNGPFDLQPGDTEAKVAAAVESFLHGQEAFSSETYTKPTVIDHFLGEPVQKVYWLTDEQLFLHFAMGPDGRLAYIVLSVFNLRAVC